MVYPAVVSKHSWSKTMRSLAVTPIAKQKWFLTSFYLIPQARDLLMFLGNLLIHFLFVDIFHRLDITKHAQPSTSD